MTGSNLTRQEVAGLKSLKSRIKSGEIQVIQTDKSGRFAILTTEQYLLSGYKHTSKDQKIDWKMVRYIQGQLNSHQWWLNNIVGYGHKKEHEKMNRNTQEWSMEIPQMVLLVKDHKKWDPTSNDPIPTRPVVSVSRGPNTHLSELISEIMEPAGSRMQSGEVCSTEEALSKIDDLNK